MFTTSAHHQHRTESMKRSTGWFGLIFKWIMIAIFDVLHSFSFCFIYELIYKIANQFNKSYFVNKLKHWYINGFKVYHVYDAGKDHDRVHNQCRILVDEEKK